MSIDSTDFLKAAERIVRSRTADLTRGMSPTDRDQFVESEGLSLAHMLADAAEERIDDVRSDLKAEHAS